MAQNKGTLVSSPIRPLTTGMTIPTAYADEIKGGLHTVSNLAERNQIPTDRRDFGMMVYVEGSDDFYQLKQLVSSDLYDNSNWQLLALGPSASFTTEWQDSAVTRTGDPSLLVPSTGDRYLIYGGVGGWLGKDDQIAEFNGGTWSYTSPTEGMSIRVDDDQGPIWSYLSGAWERQEFSDGSSYPQWSIPTGETVSVSTQSLYMTYGDLEVDGLLDNYGKVVVINGTISGSGTIVNSGSGSVQQVDLLANVLGGTGINVEQPSLVTRDISIDLIAGTGLSLYNVGGAQGIYQLPIEPVYPQYTITASQTVSVGNYQSYFVYGDLEVFGTLDIATFGQVVILNGTLSAATGSSIVNGGNIELVDLSTMGTSYSVGATGPMGATGATGSAGYIDVLNGDVFVTYKEPSNIGSDATVMGIAAASASTNITDSVVIGRSSGGSSSVISNSVFIGSHTGVSTTGGDNTFIGYAAGRNTTSGTKNTFLGLSSGESNVSGGRNVYVGDGSGESNVLGSCNVIVGYEAGQANTNSRNVFVGYWSGKSNTSGNDNIFMGNASGQVNTIGFRNTFIGSSSGRFNISGECNTFVGHEAGYLNTTGSKNTYVGQRAGRSSDGVQNAFFGRDAGIVNTTGNNNTFLGYTSGSSNTTGGQNTYIGFNAGGSNTSGGYNVSVGFGSGGVHTGSHSVFIGAESFVQPGSSFSDDSIALGYKAVVSTGSQFVVGSTYSPIATASTTGATYGYLCLTLNNVDVKIPLYNV